MSIQEVDRARAAYRLAQGQFTRSQASALQAKASTNQIQVDQTKAAASAPARPKLGNGCKPVNR